MISRCLIQDEACGKGEAGAVDGDSKAGGLRKVLCKQKPPDRHEEIYLLYS